jgi:hypothetical protein
MITIVPALITVTLVNLFLSGKIIDIPKGTHQGGIISAIGVFIILASVFVLTFMFNKILKPFKKE